MKTSLVDSVRQDCREVLKEKAEQLLPLKGKVLVVTGGTGFVGTWVAEMIATLNDEFKFGTRLVLIARSTEYFKSTKKHLSDRTDIQLIKSDVRNIVELPKETDWLIHAAASPDNRVHASNPIETMSVIADGTSAVLRAADRCEKIQMLLNISSSLVYGTPPLDIKEISESYTGAPISGSTSAAYAEAKRYAETFLAAARTQTQLSCLSVRPFAFVGPYQGLDTPWALNNFLNDALRGNAVRVFGDGSAVRSYLYGSDAAFWLLRVLVNSQSGDCYNVGSSEGVSLERLARLVVKNFDTPPEIRLKTLTNAGQITSFVPNTSLAREKHGLSVTVPLESALRRTIDWHKNS